MKVTFDGVDALLVEKPSLAPMGPTDFELNDMARLRRLSRSSSRSNKKALLVLAFTITNIEGSASSYLISRWPWICGGIGHPHFSSRETFCRRRAGNPSRQKVEATGTWTENELKTDLCIKN